MKTLIFFLFFIGFNVSFSQSDTSSVKQLYLVTKTDGTEYLGYILSDDGREILIETNEIGKIYIPKSSIKSITKVDEKKNMVGGVFIPDGPFTTRYAFTTNALPIKKGENYAMVNLHGPEVHLAITDNFNLGIMTTWIGSPFLLAGKYSFKTNKENINFSLGSLGGTTGYLNNFRGYGGLHFANVTFGNRKDNLTLAGGYAYLKTGTYKDFYAEGTYFSEMAYYPNIQTTNVLEPIQHGPIFSLAATKKVGKTASFIFDSMFGVFSSTQNSISNTVFTQGSGNSWEPDYIPTVYRHVVENVNATTYALFLMPGMRFQKDDNRAFQISIAGVSVIRGKGWSDVYDKTFSFPIPMLSWFFKF